MNCKGLQHGRSRAPPAGTLDSPRLGKKEYANPTRPERGLARLLSWEDKLMRMYTVVCLAVTFVGYGALQNTARALNQLNSPGRPVRAMLQALPTAQAEPAVPAVPAMPALPAMPA